MKPARYQLLIRVIRLLLAVTAIAGLIIAWQLVGTEHARLRVAGWVLARVQDPASPQFELEGLRWPEPRMLEADTVRLIDPHGGWLELHGVRARIGFRGLVRRRLVVPDLLVERVVMHRLPASRRERRAAVETSPSWRFEVTAVTMEELFLAESVAGKEARGRATGSVRYHLRRGGDADVALDPAVYDDLAGRLSASVSWSEEGVRVRDIALALPGGSVHGELEYGSATRSWRANLASENTQVDWIAAHFGHDAKGHAAWSCELTQASNALRVAWRATAHGLAYRGAEAPLLETEGVMTGPAGRRVLESSAWRAPEIRYGAHTITSVAVKVRSDGSRWMIEAAASADEPLPVALQTEATVERSGSRWTVTVPRLQGSLAGAEVIQHTPSAFRWDTNRWAVQVPQLAWGDAAFRWTAMGDARRMRTQGFLRGLDASHLPEKTRSVLRDARFDVQWDIGGFPAETEGHLTVNGTSMAWSDDTLTRVGPSGFRATAHLTPEAIRLEAQTHGASHVSLLAGGRVPGTWTREAPWFLAGTNQQGMVLVHAALEPLAAPYLANWQHVRGLIKAQLGVHGAWPDLAVTGKLELADGHFEDVVHSAVLREVHARADIVSRDTFRWSAGARDAADGSITVTGSYQRASGEPFILRAGATLTNFVLTRLFGTDVPIDGALTLSGTGATARLAGTVDARPLVIRLPRQLPPAIRSINVVERHAMEPPAVTATNGSRIRMTPLAIDTDIRIRAARGVRVNGRQLRSEWTGRGHLTGVLPDLRIGGSISLVRGSFMFLGRRFNVTRGEIILPSGARAGSPVVLIAAETRASGATIFLQVEGPSDEPTLTLSSNPPLDRNEIVARLLFGKPSDAVSPFQIAYLAYGLDLLEGGGPLLQQLDKGEQILGLDHIDIKQSEEESGLSAVVFGKRLMDRLYFEGEVGLRNEPDVFAVEAELTPNLILRTETSPRIREGISINWRRDY